jgi:hypothetical protein
MKTGIHDCCSRDTCSPTTVALQTLAPRPAPAAYSFLQLLVRTLSNKKPIRKILEPDKDLALTINFISAPTLSSSSPLVLLMLRKQVCGEQVSGEQLSGKQQSGYLSFSLITYRMNIQGASKTAV